VSGVGINFGGPVDAEAGIVAQSHHVPGWEGLPLAARVGAALRLPAVLENDANGQALAEWRFGAGRGSRAMAYLNVGTGIGGGLVLDGRLWRGVHGLAGEFGHLVIRPGGPPCPCGRYGCLEAVAAGPAMARRAREALAALPADERARSALIQLAGSVDAVTGRELTAAAASDDPLALRILDEILADLALGVVDILNSVDPDVLVVGGGAATLPPPLFERLRASVNAICLPEMAGHVRLAPAALGGDVGIFGGAAALLAR
jgi:glucokinase